VLFFNSCKLKFACDAIFSSNGARVSGVVEEKPGTLEYEVALYKEAPPKNKTMSSQPAQGGELPVEQAVQIGTKLQLRARINPQSGKHPSKHS
jgi:hypothetical protein